LFGFDVLSLAKHNFNYKNYFIRRTGMDDTSETAKKAYRDIYEQIQKGRKGKV
jgi:hypothetical protein